MEEYVKALRTGPSGGTPFGYVRTGLVHDIPVSALGDGWERASGSVERVTEPAPVRRVTEPAPVDLTNAELKAQLDALGVKYTANTSKAQLLELLEADDGR